jgi:hypothetical protein
MTEPLSPAAQAVLDAYETSYTESGLVAALRSLASTWETEISGQPRTEFISGIRNCITSLREIAEDLEGQS